MNVVIDTNVWISALFDAKRAKGNKSRGLELLDKLDGKIP
jgi:predicted nucleic acid-binding protein